eukprot:jgi/Chlat1/6658/Chrsp49S06128
MAMIEADALDIGQAGSLQALPEQQERPSIQRSAASPSTITLPFSLRSCQTAVWDLGRMYRGPFADAYFFKAGQSSVPYPIGYRAICKVHTQDGQPLECDMEVRAGEQGPAFIVRVSGPNTEEYIGTTPSSPWARLALARDLRDIVNGPVAFGFSDPWLQRLLRTTSAAAVSDELKVRSTIAALVRAATGVEERVNRSASPHPSVMTRSEASREARPPRPDRDARPSRPTAPSFSKCKPLSADVVSNDLQALSSPVITALSLNRNVEEYLMEQGFSAEQASEERTNTPTWLPLKKRVGLLEASEHERGEAPAGPLKVRILYLLLLERHVLTGRDAPASSRRDVYETTGAEEPGSSASPVAKHLRSSGLARLEIKSNAARKKSGGYVSRPRPPEEKARRALRERERRARIKAAKLAAQAAAMLGGATPGTSAFATASEPPPEKGESDRPPMRTRSLASYEARAAGTTSSAGWPERSQPGNEPSSAPSSSRARRSLPTRRRRPPGSLSAYQVPGSPTSPHEHEHLREHEHEHRREREHDLGSDDEGSEERREQSSQHDTDDDDDDDTPSAVNYRLRGGSRTECGDSSPEADDFRSE